MTPVTSSPALAPSEAAVLTALCNDPIALAFLRSASFRTAKRPLTKSLLQRLDLGAILRRSDPSALEARASGIQERELGVPAGHGISAAIAEFHQQFARAGTRAAPPRSLFVPGESSP